MNKTLNIFAIINNTFFARIFKVFLLIGLSAILIIAPFYGVDILSMLRFFYTILFWVWGPGLLFIWICRLRPEIEGFWTLGFAFGIILFSTLFASSYFLSFTLAKTFIGPLATLCFLLVFLNKHDIKTIGKTIRNTRFFWVCGLMLVCVVWCMFFLRTPAPFVVNGSSLYYQDLLWTVGNIDGFQRSFPPIDARIEGEIFYYHYFSMLYRAALCEIGMIDSFIISTFFYPISNVFFLVFSLQFLFTTFTRKKRSVASCFFVCVTLFTSCASSLFNLKLPFGFFNNVFYHHLFMPTHGFELSLPFFALTLGILTNIPLWHIHLKRFLYIILFTLSFYATASKGPAGLLLSMSACTTLLIYLFFRDNPIKKSVSNIYSFSFLAVSGGFIFSYFLLLGPSGGANTLSISPGWLAWRTFGFGGAYSVLYSLLIPFHILGFLPFGAYGSVMWFLNVRKNIFGTQESVILTSALAGIGGAYFLRHDGMSNLYFLMFAIPCMNVLATEWICCRWSSLKKLQRIFTISILFLVFSSFFFSGVFYGGRGLLVAYKVLRGFPTVSADYPYSLSKEEYEALDWISENTPSKSVLASEKFWISETRGRESNARFFYYSAFSKRQMYLEGWAYSNWVSDRSKGGKERSELQRRLIILNEIFSNGENADQIMRQEGIDYILVDKSERPSFSSSSLKCLFENERVAVYSFL